MTESKPHKFTGILTIVFYILFFAAILLGMIGRTLCIRDNDHYTEKLDEIYVVEEIAMVLHSEENGLIYVCYNDASCVNVYTETGEFKWAVSTPYLRNAYFDLADGMLAIYNSDVYLYDAVSGDFIERTDDESIELGYDWETESAPISEMSAGDICYDAYEVNRIEADGSLTVLVDRPEWYIIFNIGLCWLVGFSSGIGLFVLAMIDKFREAKAQKRARAASPTPTPFTKKAKVYLRYFQITSAFHAVYAVANIVCAFFGPFLSIVLLPVGIHFIISSIVLYNLIDHTELTEYEETLLSKWKLIAFFSFLAAFLSVIAGVMIAE